MKKIAVWLLLILLVVSCLPAQAATPYRTYTQGTDRELVET